MRVSVVAVGRAKRLAEAARDYGRRAERHWKLDLVEVRRGRGKSAAEVLRGEAKALRARLRPEYRWIALTRDGEPVSSAALARLLGELSEGPAVGVHFIVGGSFGLAPSLVEACHRRLSLSALTLPHELARLVLLEQLYRAGTLLARHPYHKGPR